MIDERGLADLVAFARVEVQTADVEPWALMISTLHTSGDLTRDEALWVVKLYNSYDDFGSAWSAFRRWPSPTSWERAPDREQAADYPIMPERRNLFGGRILRHFASYVAHLEGETQESWLARSWTSPSPADNWHATLGHLRQVWGVGRLAAFEWAEFVSKVLPDAPLDAPDGCLWESSGPRESLERLYGLGDPSHRDLEAAAHAARDHLEREGVPLRWVDFETIVCDFNVMRKGRYYPGRHLAALRAEIDTAPGEDREVLNRAWRSIVPEPWVEITPGIDKALMPVYRNTGRITTPFGTLEEAA